MCGEFFSISIFQIDVGVPLHGLELGWLCHNACTTQASTLALQAAATPLYTPDGRDHRRTLQAWSHRRGYQPAINLARGKKKRMEQCFFANRSAIPERWTPKPNSWAPKSRSWSSRRRYRPHHNLLSFAKIELPCGKTSSRCTSMALKATSGNGERSEDNSRKQRNRTWYKTNELMDSKGAWNPTNTFVLLKSKLIDNEKSKTKSFIT